MDRSRQGTGRISAGKAGASGTWTEKVEHRQDTARSRQGMARLSQSTSRMQAGHGQRRQDTGKAWLDVSK